MTNAELRAAYAALAPSRKKAEPFVLPTDRTLGMWCTTAAGLCHYFLAGKPLCGESAQATGPARLNIKEQPGSGGIAGFRDLCPACVAANEK